MTLVTAHDHIFRQNSDGVQKLIPTEVTFVTLKTQVSVKDNQPRSFVYLSIYNYIKFEGIWLCECLGVAPPALDSFSLGSHPFMVANRRVIAILVGILVYLVCSDTLRTKLAQNPSAETPEVEDLCPVCGGDTLWQKAEKEGPNSCCLASATSFVEPSSSAEASLQIFQKDDLVLPNLSHTKFGQNRLMRKVPSTLEQSLAAAQTEESSFQKSQEQGDQGDSQARQSWATRRCDAIVQQGPMDPIYTSIKTRIQESGDDPRCRHRPCGREDGRQSDGDGAAETYAGGESGADSIEKPCYSRHRTVGTASRSVGSSRGERAQQWEWQRTVPWAHQQIESHEGQDSPNRQQDQGDGCRMVEVCPQHTCRIAEARKSLSQGSRRTSRDLQQENGGTAENQAGDELGIKVDSGRSAGRCGSLLGYRIGTEYGESTTDVVGCWECPRDFRRQHGGATSRWRGSSTCGRDRSWQKGSSWQSSSSAIQASGISQPSCSHPSETEAHQRQGWKGFDHQPMSLSFLQQGIQNMQQYFEGPFPWNCSDASGHVPEERITKCDLREQGALAKSFVMTKSQKSVSFAVWAEVHIWQEDEVCDAVLPCLSEHDHLRTCWHLHGQLVGWHQTCEIISQLNCFLCPLVPDLTSLHRLGCDEEINSPVNEGFSWLANAPTSEMRGSSIAGQFSACQPVRTSRRFAEVWYLHCQRHPLCLKSRRIEIFPNDDGDDLDDRVRRAWFEVVRPEVLHIIPVQPNPESSESRIPHLLAIQGFNDEYTAILVKCEALPPLSQKRAVTISNTGTVVDVFQTLQLPQMCRQADQRCCLTWTHNEEEVYITNDQVVRVASGSYLHGFARVVQDLTSDEDEDDQSQHADVDDPLSEQSTTCSRGDSDVSDDDDDVVSLMSAVPPIVQTRGDGGHYYPWLRDPNDPESDEEDLQEQAITIGFADGHDEMIRYTLQETCQDALVWTAVTFGLGVVDLGRRDVRFDPRSQHSLLSSVAEAWRDHAQRGDLRLYKVIPQPLVEVPRSIVLIVEVIYGPDQNVNEEAVLVLEHCDHDVQVREQLYAARLTNWASHGCITAQLGHHCCFPLGIRDCTVFLGGEQVTRGEFREVAGGDLVAVIIGEYPSHVTQAYEIMRNAEAFFLSMRSYYEEYQYGGFKIHVRVHGISPSNTPLEARSEVTTFDQIHYLAWFQQIADMWPFSQSHPPEVTFVAGAIRDKRSKDDALEVNLIVNYAAPPPWRRQPASKVPVLITQSITSEVDDTVHEQQWATLLSAESTVESINRDLQRNPFWAVDGWNRRLFRGGRIIREMEADFVSGDQLDICYQARDTADMLKFLMQQTSNALQQPAIHESIALLQISTQVRSHHDQRHVENGMDADQVEDVSSSEPDVLEKDRTIVQEIQQLVHDACQPGWVGLNCDFQCMPCPHPAAIMALQQTKEDRKLNGNFHIFTDGSAKQGKAAWAFVLLVESCGGDRIQFIRVGYSGALLTGQGPHTASDAEATAIIAACEFLLSRENIHAFTVQLHYDAQAIGEGACGTCNVQKSTSHDDLPKQARIMMTLVERKFASVKGNHVKAHACNPFNEMADGLAGAIREGWKCPIEPVLRSQELRRHELREWAWLEISPDAEVPSIHQLLLNRQGMHDTIMLDPLFQQNPCTNIEASQEFAHLCFATANVGTMGYASREGETTNFKAKEIMHQLQGCDFVGIQESRARTTQTVQDGPFIRLIVEGMKGQAGVELWVNSENLRNKFNYEFDYTQDLMTWHHNPRCLAVHCQVAGMELDIVVLYAPQAGRPDADIQEWWSHIEAILDTRVSKCPVVILGDLNCKVGSVTTDEVGDLSPDFEDVGGECMRHLAHRFKLLVPSTMHQFHEGPGWTFVGTRGHKTRVDYIMISDECRDGIVESRVAQDVDLLNGERDHMVLQLWVDIQISRATQATFKRSNWYDRQHACQHFRSKQHDECFKLPKVAWEVGVHEHWACLRDHLREYAVQKFPKTKRQQRQLYFTEEAWSLVCQRKDVRQCYQTTRAQKRLVILRQFFRAWNAKTVEEVEEVEPHLHMLNLYEATLWERRLALDVEFRQRKRQDWKNWVQQQLETKIGQSQDARGAYVFRIFQPKKMVQKHQGKLKRPLPGLVDQSGELQLSRGSIACAWQKQFSQIENAVPVAMSDLHDLSKPKHVVRSLQYLKEMPTLLALEKAVRGLQTSKATGADGIGAELVKLHGTCNVQKLFMLMTKMSIRGQSTPEATGGWLIPLHKKGSHRQMLNYRAIMLEPVFSRAISRAWRPVMESALNGVCAPMQHGGRKGMGIEGVHMNLRMWQQNAACCKRSLGLIFVDLRSAFYTVIKPLLATQEMTLECMERAFQFLHLPHEAWHEFRQILQDSNLVRAASASDAVSEMVASTLAHTWFCIPGGDQIFAPQTGSRPGDPLADLMFSFIIAKILDNVNEVLADGQVFDDDPEGALNMSRSVTWVDDMAFAVHGSAEQLVPNVTRVMSELLAAFNIHGFQFSYGTGKTATILEFHGPNATRCRQECEQMYPQSLPIWNEYFGMAQLPIVAHYKHLGGFICRGGAIQPEVQVRAKQAISKLQPLRSIIKNRQIPLQQRRQLLKSMVLSVFTLHSGTWSEINNQAFQTWKGALFRIYAALKGRHGEAHVEHCTYEEVALEAQSPMPMELLHLQKLRLFRHLLQEGDTFMFSAMIHNLHMAQQSSWIAGLLRSLTWMQDQIGDLELPDCAWELDTLSKWQSLKSIHQHIRKCIARARQAHMWRVRVMHELQEGNQQQEMLLREMGWEKQTGDDADVETLDDIKCQHCQKSFPTFTALSVHEQRKHGIRIAVRRFARDATCSICRKFYHTRARLLHHWQHSKTGCWYRVFRQYSPMSVSETQVLDEQDLQSGTAFHQHGLKSRSHDMVWRMATQDELQKVMPDYSNADVSVPTPAEIEQWKQYGLLPTGIGDRPATSRQHKDLCIPNVVEDAQALEWKLLGEIQQWKPPDEWIPRPLSEGTRYLLILFSGHRRQGDIGCHMQWSSDVVPISIDLALDKDHGDVLSPIWIQLIQARRVIGCQAGPPCETFSEARWLPPKESGRPVERQRISLGSSFEDAARGCSGIHGVYLVHQDIVHCYACLCVWRSILS